MKLGKQKRSKREMENQKKKRTVRENPLLLFTFVSVQYVQFYVKWGAPYQQPADGLSLRVRVTNATDQNQASLVTHKKKQESKEEARKKS